LARAELPVVLRCHQRITLARLTASRAADWRRDSPPSMSIRSRRSSETDWPCMPASSRQHEAWINPAFRGIPHDYCRSENALDLREWNDAVARVHDALYVESREPCGADASPISAILDAQSAKGVRDQRQDGLRVAGAVHGE
jgi:hypothetical protein